MLNDIIDVRPLEGYKLYLRFDDGVEGIVDISKIVEFTGIFTPLQEREYFAKVQVNPDLGTIQWQNEADLDPVVLYATITNQAVPDNQTSEAENKVLNATADTVTIHGIVMHIQTPNSAELSGMITLFGAVIDKVCKIQAELVGRDYIFAIKAYQERIPVFCRGDLIKENDTFTLKNPHELTLDETWYN
ncbi:MAG TPA: DUF2442 domain-containing protein [Coleofasciculaceae cyanobacterium]